MIKLTCQYCGHTHPLNAKFCTNCGKKVEIPVENHEFMTDKLMSQLEKKDSDIQEEQTVENVNNLEENTIPEENIERLEENKEEVKEETSEIAEIDTKEETAEKKEDEEEPLMEAPVYEKSSPLNIIASFRVPEVKKKSKNRIFFWLFIVFFAASIGTAIFGFKMYEERNLFLEFYLNDIVIKDLTAEKAYKKDSILQYSFVFLGNGISCSDQYFYVKILNPDGSLRRGISSPENYTACHKLPFSGEERIVGFDPDLSKYEKGEYIIRLYYKDRCIYKTSYFIN